MMTKTLWPNPRRKYNKFSENIFNKFTNLHALQSETLTRYVAQKVIADMNSSLLVTLTKEEVRITLKQMDHLKS